MAKIKFLLQELDFADQLLEFLNANIDEISPALVFDQSDQNERVQIDDVSITKIHIHEDGQVEVEYEYSWSFYAGCKDINDSGLENDSIVGRIVGGVIEFDVTDYPDRQTPAEEL